MRSGKEKQDSAEEVEEARFPARAFDEPKRNLQNITPASEAPCTGYSSLSYIDIDSVKDLIGVYLQKGKNKDDVAAILSVQNGIHPGITHRAWNRLKEEKPELFNDYMEKLILRQMSNLSLDQQHHLLPAKSPPLAQPNLGFSQKRLVATLDGGDTIPLQLPIPSGNLQIDSYRQFVNDENPASASFHPGQMNYGRGMVTNRNAVDVTSLPSFKKPRISNPASVTYNDQTQIMSHFGANTDWQNFLEHQGPGSSELTENSASVTLFDSREPSTKTDEYRDLPFSDSQSEDEY